MKTALVTGANGFIGSFLVERLIKEGFEVRCLVRKTSNLRWVKDLPVRFYYGDITDPKSLTDPLKNVEYVFHLAGVMYALAEGQYYNVNHLGTLNLLEACKQAGSIKKFIYVSTNAVTGPNPTKEPLTEDSPCSPITFYGGSKLKGEMEVKKYQQFFSVIIIRPPVVYGPRSTDFLLFLKVVKMGIKPRFGGGEKFISLCNVDDLVEAIFKVSQSEKASGKTYFVCDKTFYLRDDIVDEIALLLNKRAIRITIPDPLLFAVALINEIIVTRIMRKPALLLNRTRVFEFVQKYWIISPKKIEDELGFVAKTSLSEGIGKSIEWFKANGYL